MSNEHDRRPAERAREEERIFDLLTDRATYGLSESEETELAALLRTRPDIDPDSIDRAAAALELTWSDAHAEPLPEHVYQRVLARLGIAKRASPPRGKLLAWTGWAAALAASLVALFVWRAREGGADTRELDELVARVERASDVVRVPWKPTEDPDGRGVKGEVVWSASEQGGYLRLEGLAVNDPKLRQYQLWIFDATRDERYPVDGGVFDFAPGSTGGATSTGVIVPIRARLPVHEPKLFAVTLEQPGGVVVSSRERIVALASL